MRFDFTLVLYWASLGISAAAVLLFLWLMREGRGGEKSAPHPDSLRPGGAGNVASPLHPPRGEGQREAGGTDPDLT